MCNFFLIWKVEKADAGVLITEEKNWEISSLASCHESGGFCENGAAK